MKFDVGVNFKMTSKGSKYSSKSDRSFVISHAERYPGKDVKYYKNHNIDLSKSRLNDIYKTPFSDVYSVLADRFKNKADIHDKKAKSNYDFKRCYGSDEKNISAVDGYLGKYDKGNTRPRWLKPLRTVPFKFCTMTEKIKLIGLCQKRGVSYPQYAEIVNRGYRDYTNLFNKKNKYMKISEEVSNLDEPGGDHSHIEYVGLGTTAKGKPSMSFNRAVKQTIKGHAPSNYKKAMSKFRSQQSKVLLKCLSNSFKQAGLNIDFNMVSHARDKHTYINNLQLYKQAMTAVDQAKADEANAKARKVQYDNQAKINQAKADKSFQRLSSAMDSLQRQNDKLRKRNEKLSNHQPKILQHLIDSISKGWKIRKLNHQISKLENYNRMLQDGCRKKLKTALENLPDEAILVAQLEDRKKTNIYLRHKIGIHNVTINRLKTSNAMLHKRVKTYHDQLVTLNKTNQSISLKLSQWIKVYPQWQKALNKSSQALANSRTIQTRLKNDLPILVQHGKHLRSLEDLSTEAIVGLLYRSSAKLNGSSRR